MIPTHSSSCHCSCRQQRLAAGSAVPCSGCVRRGATPDCNWPRFLLRPEGPVRHFRLGNRAVPPCRARLRQHQSGETPRNTGNSGTRRDLLVPGCSSLKRRIGFLCVFAPTDCVWFPPIWSLATSGLPGSGWMIYFRMDYRKIRINPPRLLLQPWPLTSFSAIFHSWQPARLSPCVEVNHQ